MSISSIVILTVVLSFIQIALGFALCAVISANGNHNHHGPFRAGRLYQAHRDRRRINLAHDTGYTQGVEAGVDIARHTGIEHAIDRNTFKHWEASRCN